MSGGAPVTLSNENGSSRFRPCQESRHPANGGQRPAPSPGRTYRPPTAPAMIPLIGRRT
jgi:hypothetical protein